MRFLLLQDKSFTVAKILRVLKLMRFLLLQDKSFTVAKILRVLKQQIYQ